MTDHRSPLSRRAVLSGLCLTPLSLTPLMGLTGQALAHEGHDHGRHGIRHVTVTPTVLRRRKKRLDLALTIFNTGNAPLTLEGISVAEAKISGATLPFEVPAGALEEQKLTLRFADQVPGIFTLLLDFGADGQGPVTVML